MFFPFPSSMCSQPWPHYAHILVPSLLVINSSIAYVALGTTKVWSFLREGKVAYFVSRKYILGSLIHKGSRPPPLGVPAITFGGEAPTCAADPTSQSHSEGEPLLWREERKFLTWAGLGLVPAAFRPGKNSSFTEDCAFHHLFHPAWCATSNTVAIYEYIIILYNIINHYYHVS